MKVPQQFHLMKYDIMWFSCYFLSFTNFCWLFDSYDGNYFEFVYLQCMIKTNSIIFQFEVSLFGNIWRLCLIAFLIYESTVSVQFVLIDFSRELFCHFQIFMDPFEEMGMGARFAEQQRRSATEKEVWYSHVASRC